MDIPKEQIEEFKKLIESDESIKSDIEKLLNYLPYCEYELIIYMIEKKVWKGNRPKPPKDFKKGSGSIELGLFLYWLKNPKEIDLSSFTLGEALAILAVIAALNYMLADSKIDETNYDFFKNGDELIYLDGSVLSIEKYATYDQGWFIAFINLVETTSRFLWYNNGKFPTTPPPRIKIEGKQKNTVSIALLGDWGAGNLAAKEVMARISVLKPDYIMHLGDVYYSGTPSKGKHYFSLGEEYKNLLDLWPKGYVGKSFTLNSNHEMYSGANGLFIDALKSAGTPFVAQYGASCFALDFDGYTLLGLDTAYMGKVKDAFMIGSIGKPSGFQSQWIKNLKLDPKKTIVFSHHNGFADDCTSVSPLWSEIREVLGDDPFAWYWGHVHNGIVYDMPMHIPDKNGEGNGFSTTTYARCLGHAALPYGDGESLQDKPITWRAQNKRTDKPKELYNGFAMLTLKSNGGAVNSILEQFYDTSSKAQPVYQKHLGKNES
ncbi:metallophosphoesterase family protein [Flavivirga eckloniae]|uniref:Calcineurin-like phosphoesterase domain-containing protein n=1 Tax=Flavivirga eckloniae TaxID=1803846 RepID=A0A2K9PKK4_9FLAO|nr:metallophosphoesterase [Flavivirga eckloniae]AUP77388.1 hypothetical protein C1H87_01090 [Flavivirga eckloniae]